MPKGPNRIPYYWARDQLRERYPRITKADFADLYIDVLLELYGGSWTADEVEQDVDSRLAKLAKRGPQ